MPIKPEPLNPWMPITDIRLCALLNKCNEELQELGKAISRTLMQGLDGTDPKTGEVNRDVLQKEIADVRALCTAVVRELELDLLPEDRNEMVSRTGQKFVNVFAWLDMIALNK